MNVLYFTVFTGIESVPPCTSDLGVTIQIGFRYTQHGGNGEFKELFFPDVQESALRGDTVMIVMRSFIGTKSAVMGCFPHYFLLRGQPELLIVLFPMVCACTHFRRVPAYVVEGRSGLNKGCIEAQCSSKNKRDRTRRNYDTFKSTVQLILGDVCWTKVNPFQGERKVDSRWDEVDYEITRQVTNGSSSYETKDSSGKMKAPH